MQEFFSEVRTRKWYSAMTPAYRHRTTATIKRSSCWCRPPRTGRWIRLVTLAPGEEMDEQPFHEGEEFGYVLLGKIQLKLDDKVYTLKKDECFYFTSDKRHSVKKSESRRKGVVGSHPPHFYY